ncbi:hypothetical protein [Microbacterium testaceum]|uniref:hypothetical protein n=1 Tax=Microbacterium testaceum TaxID=2033 RepID=UPI001D172DCD|nr:hypothetical protein [Microbacterium testaceum]MCC4250713.1 hypothetical protein [Microbacterium testaceum]
MNFPHGSAVHRQRAKTLRDEYADEDVAADWSDPDEIPIPNAFVAQSSTSRTTTANRVQMLEAKSLFCPPDFDIRANDRIRDGGIVYTIDGIPAADTNPFTGWTPVREIPLTRAVG